MSSFTWKTSQAEEPQSSQGTGILAVHSEDAVKWAFLHSRHSHLLSNQIYSSAHQSNDYSQTTRKYPRQSQLVPTSVYSLLHRFSHDQLDQKPALFPEEL